MAWVVDRRTVPVLRRRQRGACGGSSRRRRLLPAARTLRDQPSRLNGPMSRLVAAQAASLDKRRDVGVVGQRPIVVHRPESQAIAPRMATANSKDCAWLRSVWAPGAGVKPVRFRGFSGRAQESLFVGKCFVLQDTDTCYFNQKFPLPTRLCHDPRIDANLACRPRNSAARRIGTVLNGTYRLDAFLGQGMTGITYNAWHLRQKQPFAVKLLHRDPAQPRASGQAAPGPAGLGGVAQAGLLAGRAERSRRSAVLACELLIGETLRERLAGPLPRWRRASSWRRWLGRLAKRTSSMLCTATCGQKTSFCRRKMAARSRLASRSRWTLPQHHLRRRPIGLDESLPLQKLAYLAPRADGR